MKTKNPQTQLLYKKSSADKIERQKSLLENNSYSINLLNAAPEIMAVLNQERQVVYVNRTLFDALKISASQVYGLRPGELFSCVNAKKKGGCGATEFCQTCGALKAIISGLNGKKDIQECRITTTDFNALELRITSSPLKINNENYTIFSVLDISHEKRRKVFERLFFHDILNTAGGIIGFLDLLKEDDTIANQKEYLDILDRISRNLVDEIMTHKELINAENSELNFKESNIKSKKLLAELIEAFKYNSISEKKHLRIDQKATEINFVTDQAILRRVLGNMIKNALEAIQPGETVTSGCRLQNGKIEIWVHNPGYIPRDIQLQIFQRSFSTKGEDRGLGTYSIKLLTERYLKGKVSLTSSEEEGTIFTLVLPLMLELPKD